jgi:uncharacterized protein YndB with AHSA1/START domain
MSDVITGQSTFHVVPDRQEVQLSRLFDAPRELVFRAFTDPESIAKWWGPRDLATIVDKLDLRPGGEWRFINVAPDETRHGFHGFYHEVTPAERLVYTFEYEGVPGHVLLETVTFTDVDGKTLVTDQCVYQSIEDRDGMVAAGMQSGAEQSMDRLAEFLAAAV